MTIFVHFKGKALQPVKLHNISEVRDHGAADTLVMVNAFGGQPRTFAGVSHVAVEPERETDEEEG